mmetsp:Transcript_56771/g.182360  ORF Transcript_56771/g.182360 Transcript_56771/m.182360 type:complete len:257 (+) Transcript_56771:668-1438(+)
MVCFRAYVARRATRRRSAAAAARLGGRPALAALPSSLQDAPRLSGTPCRHWAAIEASAVSGSGSASRSLLVVHEPRSLLANCRTPRSCTTSSLVIEASRCSKGPPGPATCCSASPQAESCTCRVAHSAAPGVPLSGWAARMLRKATAPASRGAHDAGAAACRDSSSASAPNGSKPPPAKCRGPRSAAAVKGSSSQPSPASAGPSRPQTSQRRSSSPAPCRRCSTALLSPSCATALPSCARCSQGQPGASRPAATTA